MSSSLRKLFVQTESGYKAIVDKEGGSVALVKEIDVGSSTWAPCQFPKGTKIIKIISPVALSISTNKSYEASFSLPANTLLSFENLYTPGGADQVTLYFKGASSSKADIFYWVDTTELIGDAEIE